MSEENNTKGREDDVRIEADADLDDSVLAEEAAGETIKKLRGRLAACAKEKQEYMDKWQRATADFLNVRKRDSEDNERFKKYAAENLMIELLPVLQSFDLAFGNKEAWEKVDKNWRMGVEYIASQLKAVLEANGLKELNPLGQKFDPARDEAAEFEEVSEKDRDQEVLSVIQKGYAFYDRVLKAPKVKVGELRTPFKT